MRPQPSHAVFTRPAGSALLHLHIHNLGVQRDYEYAGVGRKLSEAVEVFHTATLVKHICRTESLINLLMSDSWPVLYTSAQNPTHPLRNSRTPLSGNIVRFRACRKHPAREGMT